jgi:hypothetical protein
MRMLIFQTESGFSKKRCSDVQDWGHVQVGGAKIVAVSGHLPQVKEGVHLARHASPVRKIREVLPFLLC